MRIGLVGYGTGGKNFHSPYIEAAVDCELAGIVARAPATVARARADWPSTPVFSSLAEMIESGVDAVTISTPPATRRDLVLEAVSRGTHVIADKPFAPDAAGALELVRAAEDAGVLLSVFHNRRWDADIRTLRKVLLERQLGDVWRFESRFDQDDPATLERGPAGGLLRDLGSHLVDQALWLFGSAAQVYANLDWIEESAVRTDASFMISITHRSSVHSYLSSSKLSGTVSRELRLLSPRGSYVSDQTDVQAQAVFAGQKPIDDLEGWGREVEARWEHSLSRASRRSRSPRSRARTRTSTASSRQPHWATQLNLCQRRRRSAPSKSSTQPGPARWRVGWCRSPGTDHETQSSSALTASPLARCCVAPLLS